MRKRVAASLFASSPVEYSSTFQSCSILATVVVGDWALTQSPSMLVSAMTNNIRIKRTRIFPLASTIFAVSQNLVSLGGVRMYLLVTPSSPPPMADMSTTNAG